MPSSSTIAGGLKRIGWLRGERKLRIHRAQFAFSWVPAMAARCCPRTLIAAPQPGSDYRQDEVGGKPHGEFWLSESLEKGRPAKKTT